MKLVIEIDDKATLYEMQRFGIALGRFIESNEDKSIIREVLVE